MKPPRFTLRFLLVLVTITAVSIGIWRALYVPRRITEPYVHAIQVGNPEWRVRLLLGPPHHVFRGAQVCWTYDLYDTNEYLELTFENGRLLKIEHMSYISGPPR